MTIFDQLRIEIDELYELIWYNEDIYWKIVELVGKANDLWKKETQTLFNLK